MAEDRARKRERERLRIARLRAEARAEQAAEAAEQQARGIAQYGDELTWLLAQQREQPWAEVMAQLRERAERLASEAPFLAPPGGQDGRPARRAAGFTTRRPRARS
jgi:hypothetical protein